MMAFFGEQADIKKESKMKKLQNVTYNQFFDENSGFHSENFIYFSQCNPNGNLSLYELLKLTSDIAVEDFNQRGMSREFLKENGIAILVSRDSFRIHKYPKENQELKVYTKEEKSEPLQFVRSFEIESESGEKLVSGITSWLLVDLSNRRIMPIKKFDAMGFREPVTQSTEHDCLPYGKIKIPESIELFDKRTIKFSDLDANGHTNNAKYAAFAVDALPFEFQKKEYKDFRINFAKEAMLGQKLEIYGFIDNNSSTIIEIGKTEEGVSFEAEFKW